MSAEATLAVMEHAAGTDAEWRMLALLANAANPRGVVTGVSMQELAEKMDKSERGVAGVKSRLKASGQLVVLDEGGGRGRSATYWIKLPGLAGQTPQDAVQTPQPDSGQPEPLPPVPPIPTTTSSSSRKAKADEFHAHIADPVLAILTADSAELIDGLELLRQGKKVDSKLVTPVEMAIAASAIATFNRRFEWKRPDGEIAKGADYGLGANLKSVVMRIRDRPSWDAAKHVRLVEAAWKVRWWEQDGRSKRRPTPNVIYGSGAFENVVQDAQDLAAGSSPATIKKRRYTRG